MPGRVHAILVVRPDGRVPAAFHLRRTLAALAAQTRLVDALTIVLCGNDPVLGEIVNGAPAEAVIGAAGSTSFAAAAALATHRVTGDAVWLLAQDTAPEPDALARLTGALELAPSAAFVAPKLVRWDEPGEIVSLGVTMSRLGRTVGLADGELDQGQHDADDDVLGSDIRGVLVRTEAWRELGGIDGALAGADEGLDLGVRARLAGARVALAPAARIGVAGDGVAGLPEPVSPRRRRRIAFSVRTAQLHRRLAYAAPPAVPLIWLSLLPLALWRSILHLVRKQPGLVGAEWRATLAAMLRLPSIARSRSRIRRSRRIPWSRLAPLRSTRDHLRERLDDSLDETPVTTRRTELHFFVGGGAWLVLAALVLAVVVFPALLAWPVLGGGALQPLRDTVSQLWSDAAFGQRPLTLDTVGPADPFSTIIALIGSAWPAAPSRALVVLWVLALPLAALGGWFAATRVSERGLLRIVGGALWMLSPTFLAALTQGRPAAVILHLLLPWLFFAASVAHRSWTGAGAASVVLVAVVACAPSLAPALVLLWVAVLIATLAARAGRGFAHVFWLPIPAAVVAAPLVWHQLRLGRPLALLADPGLPWKGAQVAADAVGRALLAAGIPTPDVARWAEVLPADHTWWVPLLAAPLAVLALVAPLTQRWASGIALLIVSAAGLATAFAAVGVSVAFDGPDAVALWPGAGLSLAWLGAVGGALVALDSGLAPRLSSVRTAVATVALAAVVVLAWPSLTALTRHSDTGQTITVGTTSTLPAYVAAEGRDDPGIGTIVLSPQPDGAVVARVVWGSTESLGGQSTIVTTRAHATDADDELAELTVDLVSSTADGVVQELAAHGIGFVLLSAGSDDEQGAGRALRLKARAALDQRDELDVVGDTPKGALWRVTVPIDARPAPSAEVTRTAHWIFATQGAVVLIGLLLAVPTAASRRAARRTPRVVGPYWQEGR